MEIHFLNPAVILFGTSGSYLASSPFTAFSPLQCRFCLNSPLFTLLQHLSPQKQHHPNSTIPHISILGQHIVSYRIVVNTITLYVYEALISLSFSLDIPGFLYSVFYTPLYSLSFLHTLLARLWELCEKCPSIYCVAHQEIVSVVAETRVCDNASLSTNTFKL